MACGIVFFSSRNRSPDSKPAVTHGRPKATVLAIPCSGLVLAWTDPFPSCWKDGLAANALGISQRFFPFCPTKWQQSQLKIGAARNFHALLELVQFRPTLFLGTLLSFRHLFSTFGLCAHGAANNWLHSLEFELPQGENRLTSTKFDHNQEKYRKVRSGLSFGTCINQLQVQVTYDDIYKKMRPNFIVVTDLSNNHLHLRSAWRRCLDRSMPSLVLELDEVRFLSSEMAQQKCHWNKPLNTFKSEQSWLGSLHFDQDHGSKSSNLCIWNLFVVHRFSV